MVVGLMRSGWLVVLVVVAVVVFVVLGNSDQTGFRSCCKRKSLADEAYEESSPSSDPL
jgi:hypothetical protein